MRKNIRMQSKMRHLWINGVKAARIVLASFLLFGVGAVCAIAQLSAGRNPAQELQIPAGTILPVRLNHKISTKNARPGQVITARVMQDVPLPGGRRIYEGAKVKGKVISVSINGARRGSVALRFDMIESHHEEVPIVTDLRAIASFTEVQFAQTPETTPGFGDPYVWSVTHQIGGDVKYGVGGPVTDQNSSTIGRGTFDGVLVRVRAQPGTECRGPLGEDRLQALWAFSADACGVYGMAGLHIVHAGRTEPIGEIVLAAERNNLKLPAGTAILLRVISP